MNSQDSAVVLADRTKPDEREQDATMAPTPDSDADSDTQMVEKWHEVIDEVLKAARDAFPSSPAFDAASPGAFQAYWRGVFARLGEKVTADAAIAEKLTSPPCKAFAVTLFRQQEAAMCPCCLPDVEPSFTLRNDGGVTKGDLVRGIEEFLYGERLPRVYEEAVYDEDEDMDCEDDGDGVVPDEEARRTGVLIHGANWMSAGGNAKGETYVYGGSSEGYPIKIWMYCCQWEEFEAVEAAKLRDEAEEAAEQKVVAKL
ncbi:hypothetical protein J7T55_001974 [Diaporthe amygdali]|uniref:uncharacterized protein n=1 Tax=Phomopsis amygdali TaxID=1214568 RepID=UPI0022FED937|nr:uncharacterized protein J7T55_001974 [Diaporthe amygdali]KAJ0117774.1 hypothetical protein J7T55_001974 [Diaporthe amygdali]